MSSDNKREEFESLINKLHVIDNNRENIFDKLRTIMNEENEYQENDEFKKYKREFVECLVKSTLIEMQMDELKKK